MEEINKKQREFWSGAGGDVWVDKQERWTLCSIRWEKMLLIKLISQTS